jgi:S-adenosylmethionine synthetase
MQRTAEAVSLGHPDKVADYISSYILDRLIEQDSQVKYAVEVLIKDNNVVLGGEVTTSAPLGDLTAYVKAALAEIGYDDRYASIWGDLAINMPRCC